MTTDKDKRVDVFWRLAPWLTVAAMAMTMVSVDPVAVEPPGPGLAVDAGADAGHDAALDRPGREAGDQGVRS